MQNYVQQLTNRITNNTQNMLRNNPLFCALRTRPPKKEELNQYLINVHYLISHTQPHLRLALISSVKAFKKDLSSYFFEKIFEEIGHEKWAEDDIKKNNFSTQLSNELPVTSMKQLVEYLNSLASQSPIQYAVYILVSEYMTSNFGHEVLQLFRATSKDSNQLSVLSNHVELDVEHSHGDEEKLQNLLAGVSESEMSALLLTVETSIQLIDQSFKEIYEQSQFRTETNSLNPPTP